MEVRGSWSKPGCCSKSRKKKKTTGSSKTMMAPRLLTRTNLLACDFHCISCTIAKLCCVFLCWWKYRQNLGTFVAQLLLQSVNWIVKCLWHKTFLVGSIRVWSDKMCKIKQKKKKMQKKCQSFCILVPLTNSGSMNASSTVKMSQPWDTHVSKVANTTNPIFIVSVGLGNKQKPR